MTSSSFLEICFAVNIVFANYDKIAESVIDESYVSKEYNNLVSSLDLRLADAKPYNQQSIQDQFNELRESLDSAFDNYKVKQRKRAQIWKRISFVFAVFCGVILFLDNGSDLSKGWTWLLICPLPA